VPYAVQLEARGGETPYHWSLADGDRLPAGLSLDPSGGIDGTPTAAGSTSVTFVVRDASEPPLEARIRFTLVVATSLPPNDSPVLEVTSMHFPPMAHFVGLGYELSDPEGDLCSIEAEYRGGSAADVWTPAVLHGDVCGVAPNTANLGARWATYLDEGVRSWTTYELRLRPFDGRSHGEWHVLEPFTIEVKKPLIPPSD
jgi:hypothetical protein